MRILVIGSTGLRGGLQIHFNELTRFMREEGHTVFTIEVSVTKTDSVAGKNQRIVRVGNEGQVPKIRKALDWIAAVHFAKSLKTDLHVSTASGWGYAFLGRFMPNKSYGFFQVVNEKYERHDRIFRNMLKGHDAVSPQSRTLGTIFREKMLYDGPLRILPCFHQIQSCGRIAKRADSSSPIRLAYFGRLAANKGLKEFLSVFADVCKEFKVTLDIWGSGPEQDEIRGILANSSDFDNRVVLRGPYPEGTEYGDLLASYHGLIAPSRGSEGIPLVLLEAASAGLPFFSCRVGGIADCENENPDVVIVGVTHDELLSGAVEFVRRLRDGYFDNQRLQKWFERNYSRLACEGEWREMLNNPNEYFRKR